MNVPSRPLKSRGTSAAQRNAVRSWIFWLSPVIGLGALAWFLIRVLPKPSRATYPCQRAAFPVASGFVIWLTGLLGAGMALGKARHFLAQHRALVALPCMMAFFLLAAVAMHTTPDPSAYANAPNAVLYANHPVGVARGIFPGRVTWVYNPAATTWNGVTGSNTNTQGWWGTANNVSPYNIVSSYTDQASVDSMVSRNIQWLTGKSSDTAAWNALFTYFNQTHGKGSVGYSPGEKIFIKTNWVTFSATDSNAVQTSNRQYVNPSPELIVSILKQLYLAGVNTGNVTMGDTVRDWPQHFINRIQTLLASARGSSPYTGIQSPAFIGVSATKFQTQSTRSTTPFYFSIPNYSTTYRQDYVPTCLEQAAYVIVLAQMKTHERNGVSLCAKQFFGSMGRNPWDQATDASGKPYYDTHRGVLTNSDMYEGNVGTSTYGSYRVFVDLSGHPKLGGNALLWIMDDLYTGYDWAALSPPLGWYSPPWNSTSTQPKYPASILMSLDPVAIDSVCLDLWKVEKYAADAAGHPLPGLTASVGPADPTRAGVEDYLVEMAQANAPPSGTIYAPDGARRLASLGAFETLAPTAANYAAVATSRRYSRNLGTGYGIELITTTPVVQGRWIFYNNSAWDNNNPAANTDDNAAIATDKMPLLPGGTASFLNYTSYSKGVNGVMIDLVGVASDQVIDASDVDCTVGNDYSPGAWTTSAVPVVTFSRGTGFNGSDRATLMWPDKSIMGKWVKVHLKANATKNIPDDVFYVGSAPGESGNSTTDTLVNRTDELACRNDQHNFTNPAAITNPHDYNRDQRVDATDELVARNHNTDAITPLRLFTAP